MYRIRDLIRGGRRLAGGLVCWLDPGDYWLTQLVFLRLLGVLYVIAFLSLAEQLGPLFGSNGILPAARHVARLTEHFDGAWATCLQFPSIFWWRTDDTFLFVVCFAGLALAILLAAGIANAFMMLALWLIYMSFINIGQDFYSFGWESLMLETTFLAVFLCPLFKPRLLAAAAPPPRPVIWLLRWLLFRVMFGAGLIKLRGDPCWQELTCLIFHYETQPIPHAFSPCLHNMPVWFHHAGVLVNHAVELIVPWFFFGPRRLRHFAGAATVLFQATLILSGNLSWLNWLTICICLSCFDDRFLALFLPRMLAWRARQLVPSRAFRHWRKLAIYPLVGLVLYLSKGPIANMWSPNQRMNTSFEPLRLVNTYGAFGTVGRERAELVVEGTYDERITAKTEWRAYEFKAKPTDCSRRPVWIAPFQYRIDWQIWFAAMSAYPRHPWLVHLVHKLLHDDPEALSLLTASPFDRGPPRFIRIRKYIYAFPEADAPADIWWQRELVDPVRNIYLPPVDQDNPSLLRFLQLHGLID